MNTANIHHHDFTMTTSVAQRNKYQVTEWEPPHLLMPHTRWGAMRYDAWLACEMGRWADKGDFGIWVEQGEGRYEGMVALFAYMKETTVRIYSEQ